MPENDSTSTEHNTPKPHDGSSPEESSATTKPEASAVARKPLPPLTSSARPAGGASRPPLPPLSSGARPVSAAAGTSAAPVPPQRPSPVPGTARAATTTAVPQSAKPAMTEARKPKQDKPPEEDRGIWRMTRKNFLSIAGWFAFMSFVITAVVGAIRLMVPRVLYEAPSAFKAGFPQDFIVGEVNEKYKDEYRVWIVREQEGFYALLAICTHLGCTPRWLPTENKFKCPCHGSGYHKDGINFEGPTPRPLERLKITLADDGQILIDRNVKFLYEKQEWSKPDAFLKYTG